MGCTEILSDVLNLYPFRYGEVNYTIPFSIYKHQVFLSELGVSDLSELLNGRKRFSIFNSENDEFVVEMEETPTVKSVSQHASMGVIQTVTMVLKLTNIKLEFFPFLDSLVRDGHDFLVECHNQKWFLIRGEETAYQCIAENSIIDNWQIQLSFEWTNLNGFQSVSF